MPEYLSPGVYIEEVDTGPRPIEGVSTSTAGMVGVTQRGPVSGQPTLVTSFPDFRRRYGGYLSEDWGDSRFLAHAVKGFFDNGGQRVYIKRVPGDGAQPSSLNVPDGIVTRLQADMGAGPTSALLVSLLGVSIGTNVTFTETVNGTVFSDTRPVTQFDPVLGEIQWAAALGHVYSQETTAVIIRQPAGTTLSVEARDPGLWGDDLRVRFEYTRPLQTQMLSRVNQVLGPTMAPTLAFAAAGPAAGATQANLAAGQGPLVNPGDIVEFADGGNREMRSIDSVAGDVLNWTGGLANNFSGGGSVIRLLVPARSLNLVVGPDPTTNPTQATLGAGQGAWINVGDTLEFTDGLRTDQREITAVAADVVSWAAAVTNDFSGPGSGARMLTAVRTGALSLLFPSVAGLQAGDVLRLTGGGLTETLTIDASWDGTSPVVPITAADPAANTYLEGVSVSMDTVALRAGDNAVRVQSSRNFYVGALVELELNDPTAPPQPSLREYFTVLAVTGNDITLSGAAANDFLIGNALALVEFRFLVRYLNEAERIDQLETFDGVSMNPTVTSKYIVDVVNRRSVLVRLTDVAGPPVPFDCPATPDGLWQQLANGDDGTPPADTAFIGQDLGPDARTGIQALTDIDQISIVAVPGKSSQTITNALIGHCETLKDRFAVIDPPSGQNIQQVQAHRNLFDTRYAAVYYPWLTVVDPLVNDRRSIPPSGHVIGIYARTDIERGVHKAPANEVVRGIVGLEQTINKQEQDILNPSPVNINVIRDFRLDGRGIRVWGARCITSDSPWRYINVRRLFIFVEESIEEGTQWVVFEPNDFPLWNRVRQTVTTFLTRVWRDGALMGQTPEEAFFVKVDRTTMTDDDIENGRLIMLIGLAAVKPAEFVIVRIGQKIGGAEIEEQ